MVQPEEVLLSHIIMMEYQNRVLMAAASARWGSTVHKMCNIVDLRGASLRLTSHKVVDIFKRIAAVDQPNYPETMGATFVVNAPWIFTAIWSVVRVFLDEGVTAKVHILGEGEPTRQALAQAVDADQLPAFLGGSCACPGGCVSGPDCTSPDGLVLSQRRLMAYCHEYTRRLTDSPPGAFAQHGNLEGAVEAIIAAAPPVDSVAQAAHAAAAVAAAASPKAATPKAAATPRASTPRASTPKSTRIVVTESPAGVAAAPSVAAAAGRPAAVPPARRRGWLCCFGGGEEAEAAPAGGVVDLGGVKAVVTTVDASASARNRAFDSFRSDLFQDALDDFYDQDHQDL